MPAERFWEFEDAAVDLGAVSAAAEDLGRLLTVEFATVFGNDWWSVPVPARFGGLVGVRSLVVRDSFGENVLVEPTETASQATAPWRMFRLTDAELAAGDGPRARRCSCSRPSSPARSTPIPSRSCCSCATRWRTWPGRSSGSSRARTGGPGTARSSTGRA